MSSLGAPLSAEEPAHAPQRRRWNVIESLLERASEWLNPILVKEARQALKSKQFVITFALLLIFAWCWTLLGVLLSMPGIAFGAEGKGMLYGYFLVLAIPLLVVVPFSAFRSLAAEREDGTYELISITALGARQIVSGKLGSAVLQMIVYFSALAPCVAFTYLLRGVDVFSIFFVLYYTFLLSLLLSTLGLLVATASRARHWQVLLSVVLLLLLFIVAMSWVRWVWDSLYYGYWNADQWEFWALQAFLLSMAVSYFILMLWAAGAQISFASDNRSTRLRYVMLAQQVLWAGWFTFAWLQERFIVVLAISLMIAAIHWMVMGALMIGEYPQLSPRVKRELPQSILGRILLTWFNPGSGTGYIFAIANLTALVGYTWLLLIVSQWFPKPAWAGPFDDWDLVWFSMLLLGYVTAYLGVSRLTVLLTRQIAAVGLVFSLLVTIFFVIAGAALPAIFQFWLFNFQWEEYSSLQATNWVWTLVEAVDGDITGYPLVVGSVLVTAMAVFFANLIFTAREVAQVRMAAPQRVLEEEAALHPQQKPRSPWDE